MPERTASSTTYWMAGLSTTGSISLGCALVAGQEPGAEPGCGDDGLANRVGHGPQGSDCRSRLACAARRRAGIAGGSSTVATQPADVVAVADHHERAARREGRHLADRAADQSRPPTGSPTATASEPADAAPVTLATTAQTAASTSAGTGQQHEGHPGAGGHALAAAEPAGDRQRRGPARRPARRPRRWPGCRWPARRRGATAPLLRSPSEHQRRRLGGPWCGRCWTPRGCPSPPGWGRGPRGGPRGSAVGNVPSR